MKLSQQQNFLLNRIGSNTVSGEWHKHWRQIFLRMLLTAKSDGWCRGVRQRAVVRIQSHCKIRNYSFPHKSVLALDLPRVGKDTRFQMKGNPLS